MTSYPVPTIQEMLAAENDGKVFRCVKNNLIGFKYTRAATYGSDWDFCSMNARGIVYNIDTGEVVARPFRKFFNYDELYHDGKTTKLYQQIAGIETFAPDLTGHFRGMDKIDGTLIIAYWYGGEWCFKTAGWFDTPYAAWAKQWADQHLNYAAMSVQHTYCFEVVAHDFLHPIMYENEELYLLGVVDTATGVEVCLDTLIDIAKSIHARLPDVFNFSSLDDAIAYARALPEDKEGLVITFDNGTKIKVKGTAFLARQAFFHDLSPKRLTEVFDVNLMKVPDNFVAMIPEEMPELRQQAEDMHKLFALKYSFCIMMAQGIYKQCKGNPKEIYDISTKLFNNSGTLSLILMICNSIRHDKPYDAMLRQSLGDTIWGKDGVMHYARSKVELC